MKLSPAYPNCWAKSKHSNRLPNDLPGAVDQLTSSDIPALGRTTTTAAAAASHIESFYTAVETVLMRFRHFKRYYFQLEYDWDRLEYLIALVRRAAPGIIREFDTFRAYVEGLANRLEGD